MIGLSVRANSERSPKPQVDIFVKNEDVVKVGDKEIKIIETPGHTPGCLSTIFNVKDNGIEHTAFYGEEQDTQRLMRYNFYYLIIKIQ